MGRKEVLRGGGGVHAAGGCVKLVSCSQTPFKNPRAQGELGVGGVSPSRLVGRQRKGGTGQVLLYTALMRYVKILS